MKYCLYFVGAILLVSCFIVGGVLADDGDDLLLQIVPTIAKPRVSRVVIYCGYEMGADLVESPCPAGFLDPGTAVYAWAQAYTARGEKITCSEWVWSGPINPPCCTVINPEGATDYYYPDRGEEKYQRYYFNIGPDEGAAKLEVQCKDNLNVKGRLLVSGSGEEPGGTYVGVGIYTGSFSGSTTQTMDLGIGDPCVWNHSLSGSGTVEVTGTVPYDVSFLFQGEDVITRISGPEECGGQVVDGSGSGQTTVGSDGHVDVTASLGGGTGHYVAQVNQDGSVVAGTLTISNPNFDGPIVGPLNLNRQ
jgi:hypothetical protein